MILCHLISDLPHIYAILGHISVSVESYRSSWSYMITPTYGMRTEMRTCSLFYHDPSVEPLLSHLVIMFNICMSSCFLFRETLPWHLGSIWITGITHFMLSDFWPTIYLISYWGIFHFGWDLQIFMESHDHLSLRDTYRDEDLFVILLWSSNGGLLESFILTRTFRHLDVIMFLLLSYKMHIGLMTRLHFAMIL